MGRSRQADGQAPERWLERQGNRERLRLLTCGSVDAGKSTLLGRLLHDSHAVPDDVLRATERETVGAAAAGPTLDLAWLVDGLQAERARGITIDVAYRYFSTERRNFIVADTPGHAQYTRNMVTGASNCDLAVILIDASKGVLEQTRRHSFLCALLGIQHFVIAVNKMDMVGWSEDRFQEIRAAYSEFAARLEVRDIHFLPMSALAGENVVHRGQSLPWFQGSPLLDHLETVHVASDRNLVDLRFPVQQVVRADGPFLGFRGTIASGVIRVGDRIAVLPSGAQSHVQRIVTFDGDLQEAHAAMAVTLTLTDELDIGRGDMIVAPDNAPALDDTIEAMVVWFDAEPLLAGQQYLIKHTTAQTSAVVTDVRYRISVTNLHREEVAGLHGNEVGRVRIECARPLAADAYAKNRVGGSFILIDRRSNATVAAGMIVAR